MKKQYGTHLLMALLILIWSMDAVTVSLAVQQMDEFFLLGFKTLCSLPVLFLYVGLREGLHLPRKRDIPLLIASAVLGDILYFGSEYTAYHYLPIGTVTVLLGILPAASYVVDCIVARRRPRPLVLVLIALSIGGLLLVVLYEMGTGRLRGYLACAACTVIWIVYGYVTRRLHRTYSARSITLYESVLATAILLPIAILRRPETIGTAQVLISIVLMGILTSGFGYIIEVRGLVDLGTTVSGIYVNLLPLVTAAAGYLILHQSMTPLQLIGGAVMIVSGFFVIRLTGGEEP